MNFVGGLLSEQITRKIIYLTLSLTLAILIMGGLEHLSLKIDNNFRHNLENQISRYDLGRSIINNLLHIELTLQTMYNADDLRTLDIFTHKTEINVNNIERIIKVLRDGGVYSQELKANFYDIDSFKRNISYQPDANNGYDLEVLNLTPKIIEIKDIIKSIYRNKRISIRKDRTTSAAAEKSKMMMMEIDSLLRRSTESANKIFYEAHENIEKIKLDRKKALQQLTLWHHVSITILSLTCFILFLRIMYRIRAILDERRNRHVKLEEAHRSIKTILDSIPVGVVLMESDRTMRMINKAGLDMLGAESIDDIHIERCSDLFRLAPGSNCPISEKKLLNHNMELKLRTLNGKEIPIIKNALPILLDGRKVILEAFMDISEKNKAEQKVRESEKFIQALFASVPTGIIVIDAETHTITDINKSAVDLIGAPREELINKTCHNFICPEQVGNCPIIDLDMEVDNSERVLITRTGEVIPVLKSAVKTNLNGKTLLIESFTDISRQKDIERRLEEARKTADQANKAKGIFLANMSHEIRTPMNGVIGLSHLLIKTDLNTKQKEFASRILSSANSLLRLLNDILDFSKIEAGRLDLEKTVFETESVILDAFEFIAVESERKGIERIINISPSVPEKISGDPLRLRQVLTNLAGNALKFTEQGEITISCDLKWTDKKAVILEFVVADTGIGIPKDKIGNLFDSFSQADNSITRQYGGTGLGLTISKNLIELMGGSINISSTQGEGTSFIFTVKMGYLPEDDLENTQDSEIPELPVLVAHENKKVRRYTGELLRKFQLEYEEIEDIKNIPQLVGRKKYSAVIIDLIYKKNGINGLGIIAETRDSNPDGCPEFIITGSSPDIRVHEADLAASGVRAILTRPFGKETLGKALNSILGYPDSYVFKETEEPEEEQKQFIRADVLVVEDNNINWSITKEVLSGFGIDSEWAQNGKVALKMIEQKDYDLILMDVQMPVMDGYTATKELRKISKTANIPVIAMTAHTMNEHRNAVLDSGMNDFLSKPINPDQMYATIAKWLPDHITKQKEQVAEKAEKPSPEQIRPQAEYENKHLDLAGTMKRIGGNLDLIFSLSEHYLEKAPEYIEKIGSELELKDRNQLISTAHMLRGMAGSLGVVSVMNSAARIEDFAAADKSGDLNKLYEELLSSYKISHGYLALEKYLHGITLLDKKTAEPIIHKILAASELSETNLEKAVKELKSIAAAEDLTSAIDEMLPENSVAAIEIFKTARIRLENLK
ncbi:hybrid sensor histidine kinase/response regulator [Maridesulfovibrio bastinii]|uniref:hybrid sensor histidine kinase/response regulator n=1 Tax=Maridesulfovibrio bastinii TaxID=47157 RepID=UPI0003F4D4B8|nr:PAS domain-containing hybrid sensor histidine kinase/response regulator [Maridesulfovibrio bastinii]